MVYTVQGIDFESKAPAFLCMRALESCAAAYHRRLRGIADYVYGNIRDAYPGLERRGLEQKLGTPLIDAQGGTVTYAGHSLGGDHAFSFQASDDFRVLRYFTMDG